MKRLKKISVNAARIIALTAMVGFIDGQYKIEEESISMCRTALVSTSAHIASKNVLKNKLLDAPLDRTAYLVEFRRGDTIKEVLVDAVTGRIILS